MENLRQTEAIPLNERQIAMLKELSEKTGSEHPLTETGYNEAGRSNGIIEQLVSNGEDKEVLKSKFLSISRNKAENQMSQESQIKNPLQ